MESVRHSSEDEIWSLRPWIWAVLCAVSGFTVYHLLEAPDNNPAVWRLVAATFVIIATIGFVLTAELRRLLWAMLFALGAGAVLAFVGWFTAAYNKGGEIAEYPFLAGIFALLIAAPLFQTARDEGGWRFPYARLHGHVWTDAVIGAASLAFTGVSFLLALLIGQLFELIGITFFRELLQEGWFSLSLAGFAFGAAMGLLRERDALVATLQKLVLVVFSVLAPVLAFALVGFLLSLPFTGLTALWDSGVPTTPVLLAVAAGAVGLVNAVIGDGKAEGSQNRVLRWSALALSLTILPLAVIAAISMGVRIDQYGFTPDRIWGLLAIIVASVYGVAYLVAAARSAKALLDWDDHIRPANIKIALGLCGVALFLALPILDFGAVSARDQLARLKSGVTKAGEFDWTAMAFDFGPKGRDALAALAKSGSEFERKSAKTALASESRWNVEDNVKAEQSEDWDTNFAYVPAGKALDKTARETIVRDGLCRTPCRILWLSDNQIAVVGLPRNDNGVGAFIYSRLTAAEVEAIHARRRAEGDRYSDKPKAMIWEREYGILAKAGQKTIENIGPQSRVELRTVEMQRIFVDGQAVGEVIPK
jgi:Domain of unknown function (DUF4153)